MICPTCGLNNPEDAHFCSNCGNPLEAPETRAPLAAPAPAANTGQRGVTDVFSKMAELALSKRGLRFFPSVVGIYLLLYVVMLVGTAFTAYAALGTLRFHRIVDTSCFVKRSGANSYPFGTSGSAADYKVLPHCDWFPLSVNWGAFALAVTISVIAVLLMGAATGILITRLADRLGGDSTRRLVPTFPEIARALGRALGWGLLVYVGMTVAFGVIVLAIALCAAVLPSALTAILGIALGVAAIYVFIRYLVPWYVRATLTIMIVFADDRQVRPVWRETRMRALTAWKIEGILLVIGIIAGVAGQVSGALMAQPAATTVLIGVLLYIIVLVAQFGVEALFLMMAARQTQRGWKV